ncbi:MAG: DUF3341 domain-containing protein [Armatimonadetes bacterium]|nr:DUF3341 domain-containing protein [Armatimonadota bacterium]
MSEAIYGLIAEFKDEHDLMSAAERVREQGYKRVDAFSPFPIHGLAETLGIDDHRVPLIVTFAALAGAAGGFLMQYWISVVDYPLNIGGRPDLSWPYFIPITFECMVLSAAFGAVLGMLGLNGLPQPHHPLFDAPNFDRASNDRFFICIESKDPKFEREQTEAFLKTLNAENVAEVSL